ncbi:MAG: hypothetical protein HQM13_11210 [SAR324 cluster bacterium]|nr:hypothetical protein [SAR324 cluster bacterium]
MDINEIEINEHYKIVGEDSSGLVVGFGEGNLVQLIVDRGDTIEVEAELLEEELQDVDLQEAKLKISSAVYAACGLYKKLEKYGKLEKDGHLLAQEICTAAEQLLEKYWLKEGTQ